MRPLILITNDDGVNSPGLMAAAEAAAKLGDVLIAAPRFQQSSMGRSLPKNENAGKIEKLKLKINGEEKEAYGVHGSPALAVSHGILELADRKPSLCISGINYGENLGLSISCSGTVGAAYEADSHNIPSIAVSVGVPLNKQHSSDYSKIDWKAAKAAITKLADLILNKGLNDDIRILNVNVPREANEKTEYRVTKQSRHNYSVFLKPEERNLNESYILKSKLDVDIKNIEKNSDIYALYFDKVISVTPLTWDLTAKGELEL
ncbi:5'/3'-nucleotidase SurE [Sebaldella sp. S0638]|uniref:5'/3'-nucleotidase SurE n=1 Tax=Sebaldella sp. S0638 TaxID=2957809 RepID=UPI00209E24B9|nr:5'/3'-nucleotidase SurE [Sebaldella sp. S0638]MCP1223620.1 5'/3'-nucleotidase SurE [Sebaldella sp. S0638]